MRVPMQAKPVMRNVNTAKIEAGIGQSDNCQDNCIKLRGAARDLCSKMCEAYTVEL